MARVLTTDGVVHTAMQPDSENPGDRVPLTTEDAEAVAARCNQRAEQMGIETRYVVEEETDA